MADLTALAGALDIQIEYRDGLIRGVEISSSRPLQGYRLLEGKSCTDMVRLVPLLYSVCGTAQSIAALHALESALSFTPAREVQIARYLLLQVENCRELVLRLLQQWMPKTAAANSLIKCFMLWHDGLKSLLGNPLQLCCQSSAQLSKALMEIPQQATLLEGLLTDILGIKPAKLESALESVILYKDRSETMISRLMNQLQNRYSSVFLRHGLSVLPPLMGTDEMKQLELYLTAEDSRDYCAYPNWQGKQCETTAYSRLYQQPVVKRLLASGWHEMVIRLSCQMIELSRIPQRLNEAATHRFVPFSNGVARTVATPDIGYGVVDTARGRLTHRVELSEMNIRRYHIVAPTEWNFHPRGVVAQKLTGVAVDSAQQALALTEAFALLVDPCVGYQVRLKGENQNA